jgi:hypothetical protein
LDCYNIQDAAFHNPFILGGNLASDLKILVFGIQVFGIQVFGVQVFGIQVFGIQVFGVQVFGGQVFGIQVFVVWCSGIFMVEGLYGWCLSWKKRDLHLPAAS